MTGAPRTTVSVILVNWKAAEDTLACLRSLAAQTRAADQILVVDNGSDDGSVEAIAAAFPEIMLLPTGANLGFAGGMNRGIDRATGDWIFFLNNDATLDPEGLERFVTAAEAAPPDVGMLQALMVFRDQPGTVNSTGIRLSASGRAGDRDGNVELAQARGGEDVFCPTGGAAMYRRSMLEALRQKNGVLDESFFMYWEDVDLGWRARVAGYATRYVPGVRVVHAHMASSKRKGRAFVMRLSKLNRIRTFVKNASFGFLAFTLPWTIADCVWLVREDGFAALRGIRDAVVEALAGRREVSAIARRSRCAIELRWAFGPA